jgi:hypothetical protein
LTLLVVLTAAARSGGVAPSSFRRCRSERWFSCSRRVAIPVPLLLQGVVAPVVGVVVPTGGAVRLAAVPVAAACFVLLLPPFRGGAGVAAARSSAFVFALATVWVFVGLLFRRSLIPTHPLGRHWAQSNGAWPETHLGKALLKVSFILTWYSLRERWVSPARSNAIPLRGRKRKLLGLPISTKWLVGYLPEQIRWESGAFSNKLRVAPRLQTIGNGTVTGNAKSSAVVFSPAFAYICSNKNWEARMKFSDTANRKKSAKWRHWAFR